MNPKGPCHIGIQIIRCTDIQINRCSDILIYRFIDV